MPSAACFGSLDRVIRGPQPPPKCQISHSSIGALPLQKQRKGYSTNFWLQALDRILWSCRRKSATPAPLQVLSALYNFGARHGCVCLHYTQISPTPFHLILPTHPTHKLKCCSLLTVNISGNYTQHCTVPHNFQQPNIVPRQRAKSPVFRFYSSGLCSQEDKASVAGEPRGVGVAARQERLHVSDIELDVHLAD